MSFPVSDWQFWVATLVVGGVVALIARRVLRRKRSRRQRRVTLTISRDNET